MSRCVSILREAVGRPLLRMREGVILMPAEAVAPRPASTILLLRDSAATKDPDDNGRGEIEVFMMVRHYEIDFNSGALVFPGGSVDKGDQEIIARPELYSGGEGLDAADLSFRIAGIRETFEESGILRAPPRGGRGRGRGGRWWMPNAPGRSKPPAAPRCARARRPF